MADDQQPAIQNVVFGDRGIQITYLPADGINPQTGIVELTVLEVPHELLEQHRLDDLIEAVEGIIDDARVANRQPAQQFRAPR